MCRKKQVYFGKVTWHALFHSKYSPNCTNGIIVLKQDIYNTITENNITLSSVRWLLRCYGQQRRVGMSQQAHERSQRNHVTGELSGQRKKGLCFFLFQVKQVVFCDSVIHFRLRVVFGRPTAFVLHGSVSDIGISEEQRFLFQRRKNS